MRKSNVVASLGQFVSDMRRNLTSNVVDTTFSTFGQVVCHLHRETRSFFMGLHQLRKPSTLSLPPGPLSFSPGHLNHGQDCSNFEEHPVPNIGRYRKRIVSEGSIALLLESSLDENTTFGCWVEMNNSNPGRVQWSVNLSGDSKDELGWGQTEVRVPTATSKPNLIGEDHRLRTV